MSTPHSAASSSAAKTSGKAIASIVLGVLSLVTCLLTGIPAIILGILGLSNISKSQGRITGQGLAVAGIVLGALGTLATPLVGILAALALPALNMARETAREANAANQLIQVSRALMNAETTDGKLPADIVDAAGRPLLSWRVQLLPHLGHDVLYRQFHLDEPWDSPHNLKLAAMIPVEFQAVDVPLGDKTLCQLPVGEGTLFESYGPKAANRYAPVSTSTIPDGMTQTILLVEVDPGEAVTWTKPADLHVDRSDPWRSLGELRMHGFLALFADGHYQKISRDVTSQTLNKAFSRDGRRFGEAPLTDADLNP